MRILHGRDEDEALKYLNSAVEIALKFSSCKRAKCGSVIVNNNQQVLGEGYNSPPRNLESQRRCLEDKKSLDMKVTDKTCCVHAEQRAIMNALIKTHPHKLLFSSIYFSRVNKYGRMVECGEPYCTICSKMALDVGIGRFILLQKPGVCAYSTEEYNKLSYRFKG